MVFFTRLSKSIGLLFGHLVLRKLFASFLVNQHVIRMKRGGFVQEYKIRIVSKEDFEQFSSDWDQDKKPGKGGTNICHGLLAPETGYNKGNYLVSEKTQIYFKWNCFYNILLHLRPR